MTPRIFVFLTALFTWSAIAQAPAQAQNLPNYVTAEFGTPPTIPTGPLSNDLSRAVQTAFVDSVTQSLWNRDVALAMQQVAESGDPRLAWMVSDMLRFVRPGQINDVLTLTASDLLGKEFSTQNSWGEVTDHLIAWDIPAPPDYLRVKRTIFTSLVPGWEQIFVEGDVDWRLVSWGGVLIDNREFDTTDDPCNCIPAADNPQVTAADDAQWLTDDSVVFGITLNGEARAYPRRIMEVREMVNDTLGGRDLGIPYCTLCGAAQAYFTDAVPDGVARPVLRTSGLLSRSNKVMFDLETYSVFDTFLGTALTGPLADRNITLPQATVITTTWGEWRAAHPQTTVLAEELALGRNFDFRAGRDADGPIFPVGDVDPRLPVHEDIIGVLTTEGTPVAFSRAQAMLALRAGEDVTLDTIRLRLDGGGIRAEALDGTDLGSHQAFWFAWSQFHPETALWKG